jgi:peptide/nickel transport system permease protein
MPDDVHQRPAVPSGAGVAPITEPASEMDAQGLEEVGLSQGQLAWRRFRAHKLAMISLVVLALVGLLTIFPGLITKYGSSQQDLFLGLSRPSLKGIFSRSCHCFGTDSLGRDQLARVLYGGRISLAVGLGVALSSGTVGTLIGAISGFAGGRLDNLLMRTTDFFLSFPFLVALIVFSRIFGGSVPAIVLILAIFFWMPVARIVRGVFLSLKEKEFVEAARSSGARASRIILRHMLPNTVGPIVVNMTLSIAAAILTESTLSFLGFGVTPPTPTWGNMLSDAQIEATSAPWLVWFPGLMILITVLAVNFLGDGLRDSLDPTQQRVRA